MDIIQYLANQKIEKAIENGEFKNLAGFGKPVENRDYFKVPQEQRMAFHILKNAGLVPKEVEIRKDLYHLRQYVKNCNDLSRKEKLLLKIQELEDQLYFKK